MSASNPDNDFWAPHDDDPEALVLPQSRPDACSGLPAPILDLPEAPSGRGSALSGADLDLPASGPEPPAADLDMPASGPEPPAADLDLPASDPEPPAADLDMPASDPEPPAADLDLPASDPEPPAADLDMPASDPGLSGPVLDFDAGWAGPVAPAPVPLLDLPERAPARSTAPSDPGALDLALPELRPVPTLPQVDLSLERPVPAPDAPVADAKDAVQGRSSPSGTAAARATSPSARRRRPPVMTPVLARPGRWAGARERPARLVVGGIAAIAALIVGALFIRSARMDPSSDQSRLVSAPPASVAPPRPAPKPAGPSSSPLATPAPVPVAADAGGAAGPPAPGATAAGPVAPRSSTPPAPGSAPAPRAPSSTSDDSDSGPVDDGEPPAPSDAEPPSGGGDPVDVPNPPPPPPPAAPPVVTPPAQPPVTSPPAEPQNPHSDVCGGLNGPALDACLGAVD